MALARQRVTAAVVAAARDDHTRIAEAVVYSKHLEVAAHMCGDTEVVLTPSNTVAYLTANRGRGEPLDRAYASGARPHVLVVDVESAQLARVGRVGLDDTTLLAIDESRITTKHTLVAVRAHMWSAAARAAADARDSLLSGAAATLYGNANLTVPMLNVLTSPPTQHLKQHLSVDAVAPSTTASKKSDDNVDMDGGEQIFGGTRELNSDDDAPGDLGAYDMTDGFLVDDSSSSSTDDSSEDETPKRRLKKRPRDSASKSTSSDDDSSEDETPKRRRKKQSLDSASKSTSSRESPVRKRRARIESSSDDDETPKQRRKKRSRGHVIAAPPMHGDSSSDDDFAAPGSDEPLSDRHYIGELARRLGFAPNAKRLDPYGNVLERVGVLELANPLPPATPYVRLFEEGRVLLADGTTIDADHTYTVNGQIGYTSTTTMLKRYFSPFDADVISRRMVASASWPSKLEYYGDATAAADAVVRATLTKDEHTLCSDVTRMAIERFGDGNLSFELLLRSLGENFNKAAIIDQHAEAAAARVRWRWQHAAELGREFHRRVEFFFDGVYPMERLERFAHDDKEIAMAQFIDWYRDWFEKNDLEPFRVELALVDEFARTTGCIDFLARKRKTGDLVMIDWKHSKDISDVGFRGAMCCDELAHLQDCKKIKYDMQQNVYRAFLHETTDWHIDEMYLLQCHPTIERANLIKVPVYSKETLAVMNRRAAEVAK